MKLQMIWAIKLHNKIIKFYEPMYHTEDSAWSNFSLTEFYSCYNRAKLIDMGYKAVLIEMKEIKDGENLRLDNAGKEIEDG